eukprot:jgi/Mesvir1/11949/Mv26563-RA.1
MHRRRWVALCLAVLAVAETLSTLYGGPPPPLNAGIPLPVNADAGADVPPPPNTNASADQPHSGGVHADTPSQEPPRPELEELASLWDQSQSGNPPPGPAAHHAWRDTDDVPVATDPHSASRNGNLDYPTLPMTHAWRDTDGTPGAADNRLQAKASHAGSLDFQEREFLRVSPEATGQRPHAARPHGDVAAGQWTQQDAAPTHLPTDGEPLSDCNPPRPSPNAGHNSRMARGYYQRIAGERWHDATISAVPGGGPQSTVRDGAQRGVHDGPQRTVRDGQGGGTEGASLTGDDQPVSCAAPSSSPPCPPCPPSPSQVSGTGPRGTGPRHLPPKFSPCPPSGRSSALLDYVARPDPHYAYARVPDLDLAGHGWRGYVINMTSQKWLDPSRFAPDSPTGSIWWHILVVVLPSGAGWQNKGGGAAGAAFLYVSGGSNDDMPSSAEAFEGSEDVKMVAKMAVEASVAAAVLFHVPNQPVIFAGETRRRWEDDVIAYGWRQFLDNVMGEGGAGGERGEAAGMGGERGGGGGGGGEEEKKIREQEGKEAGKRRESRELTQRMLDSHRKRIPGGGLGRTGVAQMQVRGHMKALGVPLVTTWGEGRATGRTLSGRTPIVTTITTSSVAVFPFPVPRMTQGLTWCVTLRGRPCRDPCHLYRGRWEVGSQGSATGLPRLAV